MRVCCLVLFALLLTGCGGSGTETVSNTTTSASPQPTVQSSPLTGFEKDMQFIRNGQFTYVWIFSRKDGKPLDREDSQILKANAPQVVDWVTTDGGKKVIAGTNFNLEEGNLSVLRKRFVVEDYSGR
jgi:hypothetical protein